MPDIYVPAIPARLKLTQGMVEDFLCDPVMAAKVLLGYDLDVFQRVRLRYYWWVADVIDESGFSTGKTLVDWIYIQLRCILITHFSGKTHWASIYYPNFGTGKRSFWEYYSSTTSPIFRAQLGKLDDGLSSNKREKKTSEGADCFTAYYMCGAKALLPAPDFKGDAKGQASLRINTLLVEEWPHIDAMSDGIDRQLIGRSTRENYNKEHPIWCNHRTFTAPAKPSSHISTKRVRVHEKKVEQGNTDYAVLRMNYKDWSHRPCHTGKSFREEFCDMKAINHMKANLPVVEFLGEGLGVRDIDGRGWYSDEVINPCIKAGTALGLMPVVSRSSDTWDSAHTFYFLGVDPAPAQGQKSDDGAMMILRARPKQVRLAPPTRLGEEVVYPREISGWDIAPIWAKKVRSARADEWSGIIHKEHKSWRFTKIMMDYGGGGQWVWPHLKAIDQLIDGQKVECRPIATVYDHDVQSSIADLVLLMCYRGDVELRRKWPELSGDDNLVDVLHGQLRDAMLLEQLPLIAEKKEWDESELKKLTPPQLELLETLGILLDEFGLVVVATDEEGNYITTSRGAKQYSTKDKKDFVSALYMALGGFSIWLAGLQFNGNNGGRGGGFGGAKRT
ncbi:MAG TPA: hypothetical protein VGH19_06620 [Verrucomicrobiae bacterium]